MSLDMKERMLNGKPCLTFEKELAEERQHQQRLQFKFNNLDPDDFKGRIEDLQDSYRDLENDVDDLIEDIKGAIKDNKNPDVLSELRVLLDDAKDILYWV